MIGDDFVALSEPACRDLLRSGGIARVGWQAADGQQILPVSFVCDGDRLVFRTSPYGVLSELLRPTEVAVQVDDLDLDRHSGWSVLVQGRARAVAEPQEMVRLWTVDGERPWAPGVRNLFIQVSPRRISGRSIGSPDGP